METYPYSYTYVPAEREPVIVSILHIRREGMFQRVVCYSETDRFHAWMLADPGSVHESW